MTFLSCLYNSDTLVAVLTAATVTRWLGAALENGVGLIEEEPVGEVLKHEDPNNYVLVPRTTTVFDALEAFDTYLHSGKSLAAIVVSQTGKQTERPLDIPTASDIPRCCR